MAGLAYYEQADLWGYAPTRGQQSVAATIVAMLHPDCRSVLDVGCGDGAVTNALPPHLDVVGLDGAEAPLRHVHKPTIHAALPSIPYGDNHWDCVVASDILEHLPEAIYSDSLAAIARVARCQIIVAVPNNELFSNGLTTCGNCGEEWHVNLHVRTYDEPSMANLFPGWKLTRIRLAGDLKNATTVAKEKALAASGYRTSWTRALCPVCGERASTARAADPVAFARALEQLGPQQSKRTEMVASYGPDRD